MVAYGTSKAALKGLMNNLVTEYSKHNVRINTIAPGWFESEMFLNAIETDPERKEKIIKRIAMPCFGKPEDIGNAAVFLSSQGARYITGVVLSVDGGAIVNFFMPITLSLFYSGNSLQRCTLKVLLYPAKKFIVQLYS